mmetsp:Transcript_40354/g.130622  ORF Transcript_40354/g.130622 Transcript_40354/m.130622 type:complete len:397 (+) Transcript_40354:164-1354(+)
MCMQYIGSMQILPPSDLHHGLLQRDDLEQHVRVVPRIGEGARVRAAHPVVEEVLLDARGHAPPPQKGGEWRREQLTRVQAGAAARGGGAVLRELRAAHQRGAADDVLPAGGASVLPVALVEEVRARAESRLQRVAREEALGSHHIQQPAAAVHRRLQRLPRPRHARPRRLRQRHVAQRPVEHRVAHRLVKAHLQPPPLLWLALVRERGGQHAPPRVRLEAKQRRVGEVAGRGGGDQRRSEPTHGGPRRWLSRPAQGAVEGLVLQRRRRCPVLVQQDRVLPCARHLSLERGARAPAAPRCNLERQVEHHPREIAVNQRRRDGRLREGERTLPRRHDLASHLLPHRVSLVGNLGATNHRSANHARQVGVRRSWTRHGANAERQEPEGGLPIEELHRSD